MRRRRIVGALLVSCLGARPVRAAVLRTAPPAGPACPHARFRSIQSALDAARDGDVIVACPGTYPEQLMITKRVTVTSLGDATVQPAAVVANTTNLRTGATVAAVAVVTVPATLRRLTFEGTQNGLHGCDTTSPYLVGVFFRGTSGRLRHSQVHGIRLAPTDGSCDTGTGVMVQSDGSNSIRIDLRDDTVSEYQRAGIVLNGPRIAASVVGNTIAGFLASSGAGKDTGGGLSSPSTVR